MASRTLIRQDRQIRKSDLYNDQLSGGSALESGAASLEDDLNALRSQVNRIINTTVAGNRWYAGLAGRGLDDLDTALSELETQKILFRAQVLTDVAVGAGTNYVILNVGGSEAPAETAAVSTALNGAVVAYSLFSAGPFGSNELQVVAGPNAVSPKNLVLVRDATTGSGIQSASRDVFGLLQYESSGVDGGSFDDSSGGNRVKISFVRMNSAFNGLEAVPSSDVGGRSVNYFYVRRINLGALPEEAFLITEGAGSGSSGITADEHETLRQLIHLADTGGPWEGFASGAFRETNPAGNPFPTSEIWWTNSGKTQKIVELQVTRNSNQTPDTEVWKAYAVDGVTTLVTITDSITYSGVFETSRTRVIT